MAAILYFANMAAWEIDNKLVTDRNNNLKSKATL